MSERTVTGQHDETAGPARGTVRATMSGGAGGLRAAMTGRVLEPTDDRYDTARAVWNAGIDRRPAVIAQCASAADVAAAVRFGTEQGLEIAVRGGAHSTAGAGVAEDGLVIDLSRLNDVTVDPLVARVRVGGGALLRDMDAATQAHGLAVPSGLVGHTGVGGLALGGGMGWLSRKCGLTVDNLLAAEIVTADGQIRRATAAENPDLFWAIRGGGGNFGVVTSFEFRAHGVGPIVQFGLFFWSADQGPEALQEMRDIISDLPRDVNVVVACLNAPPAPFVPEEHHLTPGYALLVTGFGSAEEHAAVAAALRARLAPLFEFVTPMPYVDLQSRRGQRRGPVLLRQGDRPRGPVRRCDRGGHRPHATSELADVDRAVLSAGRRVPSRTPALRHRDRRPVERCRPLPGPAPGDAASGAG